MRVQDKKEVFVEKTIVIAMAVQGVMHTSNPFHDYEFSWTLEHFSCLPDVLRGPPFFPIPGYPVKLCMEINCHVPHKSDGTGIYELVVSLIDLNVEDSHLVVKTYNMTIRRSNGQTIESGFCHSSEIGRGIILLRYISIECPVDSSSIGILADKMYLPDDKLVMKGKLSISGYNIVSSVSSLKGGPGACIQLLRDLKNMYLNGISADISFRAWDKVVSAHKIILRSRSSVFAKMFDTDNSDIVLIEEPDFHSFSCFLLFLYTGVVEDETWDTVLSLYSLAHKYQVHSLHEICSELLGNSLTIDSVCKVLELADLHGDRELKEVAKVFFRRHLQVVGTWSEKMIENY